MERKKNETGNEFLLKICILGNPDGLKTEFINRFSSFAFTPSFGVAIRTKNIQVDSNKIKLILVDTSSKEFFGKLRTSHYQSASAAIIMFDKGERTSFDKARELFKEFRQYFPEQSVPIILIGFITSSEEIITTEEGNTLAKELEVNYYEVKQKESEPEEVEEIFRDLIRILLL